MRLFKIKVSKKCKKVFKPFIKCSDYLIKKAGKVLDRIPIFHPLSNYSLA